MSIFVNRAFSKRQPGGNEFRRDVSDIENQENIYLVKDG